MFIKHEPHYTLQFPRKNTLITTHNSKDEKIVSQILTSANIKFLHNESQKFKIPLTQTKFLFKLVNFTEDSELSTRMPFQSIASMIKADLKTAIQIKSL